MPTQVGITEDGSLVKDFPFDNPKYSPEQQKIMSDCSLGFSTCSSRFSRLKLRRKQKKTALQVSALEEYNPELRLVVINSQQPSTTTCSTSSAVAVADQEDLNMMMENRDSSHYYM